MIVRHCFYERMYFAGLDLLFAILVCIPSRGTTGGVFWVYFLVYSFHGELGHNALEKVKELVFCMMWREDWEKAISTILEESATISASAHRPCQYCFYMKYTPSPMIIDCYLHFKVVIFRMEARSDHIQWLSLTSAMLKFKGFVPDARCATRSCTYPLGIQQQFM